MPSEPVSSAEALTLPGTSAPAVARSKAAKARKGKRPKPPDIPAPELPIARVAVDVPLPHLDRPFDYLVTEKQHEGVVSGCRVRVRFAGRLVSGYVLERVEASDHEGRIAPISRVVSSEPVLTPEVASLARAVADRYAGTLSDVLRLAIPPRHAAVESAAWPGSTAQPRSQLGYAGWDDYANGPEFVAALARGASPRAAWSALPNTPWPQAVAQAVGATGESGRGSLVVVPDGRDVERFSAALTVVVGSESFVVLTADLGPRERYRRWLAVRRGEVSVVLGTRAAMFAPVVNLGLAVVWDDGDDLHSEPRAPYPHAREVLALRAHQGDAAFLVGGFARTAEDASLVSSGFAKSVVAPRDVVRRHVPLIRASGEEVYGDDPIVRAARLPPLAWRVAHESLKFGPVLVQVPRRGYVPAVACSRCHVQAQCVACHGPLALAGPDGGASCRWCGTPAPDWECSECGNHRLRSLVVGAGRTAEELGRAFPSTKVLASGGGKVLSTISPEPALVVATPGAEPTVEGGYAAALLLDTWALLGRADMRVNEEALRRWMTASALVRPADQQGQVVLVGDAGLRPVQSLVRWDPVGHAVRELEDREAVGLPPAVRMAVVAGEPSAVTDLLDRADLPVSPVVGPSGNDDDSVRAVIRVPRAQGGSLATALRRAAGERSARKDSEVATIRIDPMHLE